MNGSPLRTLVATQFLSAFSDNAILFTVVAIVLQTGQQSSWYVPALQSVFLLAFVSLAPWVGPLADKFAKPKILFAANLAKAAGTALILVGVEPLLGYSVVGAGAALYSPAKYGILPEVVPSEGLVRANSWIEGSTIAAILIGTLVGAKIADHSVRLALSLTLACYLGSAWVALCLPHMTPRGASISNALRELRHRATELLGSPRTRLVLMALSVFWASAATLRIMLVAWAPAVLGLGTAGQIAELTLYLALGIVAGSAVVPRMIPLDKVRRARFVGLFLGLLFLALAAADTLWQARCVLLGIGVAGGMFVVPLNATMQQIGHLGIGSGATVAIQNLVQNLAMLAAVAGYTAATAWGSDPASIMLVIGGTMLFAALYVQRRLTAN